MGLKLGKAFDRNYNIRIPIFSSFYDIGIFLSKRSTFVLFSVNSNSNIDRAGTKINMYKNIESSKFCETFLNLHNYRSQNLDIRNQFDSIKGEYSTNISFAFNETITLSKIILDDNKELFDILGIYGFHMSEFPLEYIFVLCERQYIDTKLKKKMVRTSGLQIGTSTSLDYVQELYQEKLESEKAMKSMDNKFPTDSSILL